MTTIEYKIEVSQKALDILANVYSPTREECKVMKVIDFKTEKINNPFYWSFSKFWHEHAKTISDEDMRDDLIKEYWGMREKVANHRKKGKVYRKNSLFFHKSTPIGEIVKSLNESAENVRACMRDYLFGFVGVVVESFHHTIHTGDKEKDTRIIGFLPNEVPILGKPIRVIKYNKLYVPYSRADKVQTVVDSEPNELGFFEIQMNINESSLPVLKYIVERTKGLEEKKLEEKGKLRRTYVEFHDSELVRVTGMGKARTRKSFRDLLGIVAEVVHPINMRRYSNTIFLPPCRRELAEDLLKFT